MLGMQIVIDVVCPGPRRPPPGSPVLVEVRDTSLADAPSVLVADVVVAVAESSGTRLATASIDLPEVPRGATVRVHIDVDGDGQVSVGDFVSTASHPIPDGQVAHVEVPVRPV